MGHIKFFLDTLKKKKKKNSFSRNVQMHPLTNGLNKLASEHTLTRVLRGSSIF